MMCTSCFTMTTMVMRMKRKKMMKIAAWRCHALSAISASRADFLQKKLIFAWFVRWYFDIAMSSWFTQNILILMYVNILGRPCCKNCKICGETTEGCSRHNAAAIVARWLRTSAKVQLSCSVQNMIFQRCFAFMNLYLNQNYEYLSVVRSVSVRVSVSLPLSRSGLKGVL